MTDRLVALLVDLLARPCLTGEEGPLADWLAERYADLPLRRVGNSVVVGGALRRGHPTVALVGHLDVVPPTAEDRDPRVEDDRVVGRGASDMKSGLAVAMDCFEDDAVRGGPYDVVLVAYAGEEGSHESNELQRVLDDVPEVAQADLAVVLEPTDLTVQLGCLGNLQAEVTVAGRPAHSARPWQGRNALAAGGDLLVELHRRDPIEVVVDGLAFREVLVPTRAWTGTRDDPAGNARNVVPDRFTVNVNYRFAPDKSLEAAEQALVELLAAHGDVVVTDRAPPGRPGRTAPLVERFLEVAEAPIEPKQAWTDVARLSAAGVPALNFGPGLTGQAHQAGEYVPIANLAAARAVLGRLLGP